MKRKQAKQKAMTDLDKRICVICGKEYTPYNGRKKTCGSEECKRLQHVEYCKQYNVRNVEAKRRYNREYARRIRSQDRLQEEVREQRDFKAEGYAERQKERTLAMVGSVKL